MGNAFRKGSRQSRQSNRISNELDVQSTNLLGAGSKLRAPAFAQLQQGVKTGQLPMAMTGDIGLQEHEFAQQKNEILDNGVRGGQMKAALAQLPLERLSGRDQLRAKMFETALNAVQGSSAAAVQAETTSAQNLNSLGAQRIQQNQGLFSFLSPKLGM